MTKKDQNINQRNALYKSILASSSITVCLVSLVSLTDSSSISNFILFFEFTFFFNSSVCKLKLTLKYCSTFRRQWNHMIKKINNLPISNGVREINFPPEKTLTLIFKKYLFYYSLCPYFHLFKCFCSENLIVISLKFANFGRY